MLLQAYTVDEPMVAFVCNRPAMHSTDHGWVSDDSANCMSDPVDVLNYCRKVCRLYEYTLQSLTIIINSSYLMLFKNFLCSYMYSDAD